MSIRLATNLFCSCLVFTGTLISSQGRALIFDNDVPANIKSQALNDLAFMYTLKGRAQTPFHQEIFNSLSGSSYQNFFESRVLSIGMSDCGSQFAVACVIPYSDETKMWLTQNFIKFSHPQIARLMVMFHESRHTESNNSNWPHDTCPTPFLDASGKDMVSIWTGAKLEGQPACDSTQYGSYGSSTILLKNLALFCSNCNSKVKMDADLYATDQLGRIDDPGVKAAMVNDFSH